MKLNFKKASEAYEGRDKFPRKIKKHIFGKKVSKRKLRVLLDSIEIKYPRPDKYPEITPFEFCPKCGCTLISSTGNMAQYPEHWEDFYCYKCRFKVATIDNSRLFHCLEFKDNNYKL